MSFDPVCDNRSRILILGTYPSPRSRAEVFYYGNPQNRFWTLTAGLLGEDVPVTVEQKKAMLLNHGIALWDVCESCTADGASDASIRDVRPNEVAALLRRTGIVRVFCNGTAAGRLYERHILPQSGISAAVLPSTSPANARWSLPMLAEAWKPILEVNPDV